MAAPLTTIPTDQRVGSRPTVAVVDLGAVRHNIRLAARMAAGAEVMAVVKSDGYGHGMIPVARAALEAGATQLGVATADEALCLRQTEGFRDVPILVMAPTLATEAEALQAADIAVSVGSRELLHEHLRTAHHHNRRPRLHPQYDTGISRDGFRFDDHRWLEDAAHASDAIEGIWTHFAVADGTSDSDREFTNLQIDRFEKALAFAQKAFPDARPHAANSGAVMRHPRAVYTLVRPGIMIYGIEPAGELALAGELRQALSLRSRLAAVKTLEPGDTISYARLYAVPTRRRIGIVPAGYGDGYMVAMSNKAEVLVRGRRVPVRGRVCMDQFMVDLSGVPEAEVGDEVVLYGRQGDEFLSLEEAATVAGTIPYELVCGLTPRVPRVYTESS